jgi:hypothetical protein
MCRDDDIDEILDKWQGLIIKQRDKELKKISDTFKYKVQSGYFDDPRRTFNMLVKDSLPQCKIPKDQIYHEFSEKWKDDFDGRGCSEIEIFELQSSFDLRTREEFVGELFNLQKMKDLIRTRGNLSAPGMDKLINPIVKLERDSAAEMMVELMKTIINTQ